MFIPLHNAIYPLPSLRHCPKRLFIESMFEASVCAQVVSIPHCHGIYHIEASIFFVCVLLVLGIVIRMASYEVPYQIVHTHFEVSHIVLFVFKMCVHTSVRIVTKGKCSLLFSKCSSYLLLKGFYDILVELILVSGLGAEVLAPS